MKRKKLTLALICSTALTSALTVATGIAVAPLAKAHYLSRKIIEHNKKDCQNPTQPYQDHANFHVLSGELKELYLSNPHKFENVYYNTIDRLFEDYSQNAVCSRLTTALTHMAIVHKDNSALEKFIETQVKAYRQYAPSESIAPLYCDLKCCETKLLREFNEMLEEDITKNSQHTSPEQEDYYKRLRTLSLYIAKITGDQKTISRLVENECLCNWCNSVDYAVSQKEKYETKAEQEKYFEDECRTEMKLKECALCE